MQSLIWTNYHKKQNKEGEILHLHLPLWGGGVTLTWLECWNYLIVSWQPQDPTPSTATDDNTNHCRQLLFTAKNHGLYYHAFTWNLLIPALKLVTLKNAENLAASCLKVARTGWPLWLHKLIFLWLFMSKIFFVSS